MFAFTVFIHTTACILMIAVIMMQSGRGGGLTESFASAESMFGAKTNQMMVRLTTILATVFLVTSLSLAYMSSKREQSLMTGDIIDLGTTEESVPAPVMDIPQSPTPIVPAPENQ